MEQFEVVHVVLVLWLLPTFRSHTRKSGHSRHRTCSHHILRRSGRSLHSCGHSRIRKKPRPQEQPQPPSCHSSHVRSLHILRKNVHSHRKKARSLHSCVHNRSRSKHQPQPQEQPQPLSCHSSHVRSH